MDRPCRICSHPRRDEIDAALFKNGHYKTIAAQFQTSLVALLNHRSHVDGLGATAAPPVPPEQMPGAQQAIMDTFLQQIRSLCDKCFALVQTAEASGELLTISVNLFQVRRHLRTLGDLAEGMRQSGRAAVADNVPQFAGRIAPAGKLHPAARLQLNGDNSRSITETL